MKITCLILTFNEQDRIRIALTPAMKWADEVVVVDKGSSDNTRDIAEGVGAKVCTIPFSRQGHESLSDMAACAANDWVWHFTPGEVPTKKLIELGKTLVSDSVDLIMVPMYYYSFGLHHDKSPWAGGWQPRLYNRKRVTFTGNAHDPIRAERKYRIPCLHGQHILHQTHPTAQDFMRTHADYMVNEAAQGTPKESFDRATKAHGAFDGAFLGDQTLTPHMLAWKLYWLGVALHAWERAQDDIPKQYQERATAALEEWA